MDYLYEFVEGFAFRAAAQSDQDADCDVDHPTRRALRTGSAVAHGTIFAVTLEAA
jgi:hypothetical protein